MATKVIVCPECESPLVPGRYSCTGCGAVVARVASSSRSFATAEPVVPPILEPAGPPPMNDLPATDGFDADDPGATDTDQVEVRWPAPGAAPSAAATVVPQTPMAAPLEAAPSTPSWPAQPAWPSTHDVPVSPEPQQRTPAGAYLPPSAVLPSGEALPINGKNGTKTPGGDTTATRPSLAERLALGEEDGPFGLPPTLPGRTIALGIAIAGLGFLLPWAEIVIGTSSMGGFLDQWGLAGPGHALVLLLLIGVAALAVASERVTPRVSAGLAAILLGAVLLGLVFPYLMGPFQEAVGVYVVFAGALVMIAGGLLARAPRRHEPDGASV